MTLPISEILVNLGAVLIALSGLLMIVGIGKFAMRVFLLGILLAVVAGQVGVDWLPV